MYLQKKYLIVIKLCNQFVVWQHFLVYAVLLFVVASVIFFCNKALFLLVRMLFFFILLFQNVRWKCASYFGLIRQI